MVYARCAGPVSARAVCACLPSGALDDFDEEEDVRHAALIAEAARKAAGGSDSGPGAGRGAGGSGAGAGASRSGDVARAAAAASAATSGGAAAAADTEGPGDLSDMMSKLMGDMNQPQFQATLDATMRELSGGGASACAPQQARQLRASRWLHCASTHTCTHAHTHTSNRHLAFAASGTASVLNPFAGLPQGVGALPREQTDRTVAETLNVGPHPAAAAAAALTAPPSLPAALPPAHVYVVNAWVRSIAACWGVSGPGGRGPGYRRSDGRRGHEEDDGAVRGHGRKGEGHVFGECGVLPECRGDPDFPIVTCHAHTVRRQEDFQSVIDNMMKQLLSKDIMYMPMKQICDKVRVRG